MKALIFEKFVRAIQRHRLLDKGDRVIVAVSGGADSVALLHLLLDVHKFYSLDLRVAHLNHSLRGSESDADEQFVCELAMRLDVPLVVERVPAREVPVRGKNLEGWARERRYDFFSRCAVAESADRIALGHTMTDQAETLLMRLLRGSGTLGLASIPPKRGIFIRPLIDLQRQQILAYLESIGLEWREDVSNRDTRFLRNRLRHELLPLLAGRYNPNIIEVLGHTAEVLREESDAMQLLAGELFHREAEIGSRRVTWNVKGLRSHPAGLRNQLVRLSLSHLMADQRIPSFRLVNAVTELLEAGKSGRSLCGHDLRVRRQFDSLVLESRCGETGNYCYPLPIPGRVELAQTETVFATSLEVLPVDKNTIDRWELYLSEEELRAGLIIRNWAAGDVYLPRGAGSARKVSELLSRRRIPRVNRTQWPVITLSGSIVCAKGLPLSAGYLARSREKNGSKVVIEERKKDDGD